MGTPPPSPTRCTRLRQTTRRAAPAGVVPAVRPRPASAVRAILGMAAADKQPLGQPVPRGAVIPGRAAGTHRSRDSWDRLCHLGSQMRTAARGAQAARLSRIRRARSAPPLRMAATFRATTPHAPHACSLEHLRATARRCPPDQVPLLATSPLPAGLRAGDMTTATCGETVDRLSPTP